MKIETDGGSKPLLSTRVLVLILVWLVLAVGLGVAAYFGGNAYADRAPPANIGTPAPDFASYALTVWPQTASGLPPVFDPTSSEPYQVYYLWDSVDAKTLASVPVASNMQIQWPPPWGSRFRLAAYPFGSKSSGFFVWDVIKAVFDTVNTFKDVGTFPGWFVSVYNPAYWPAHNIFRPTEDNTAATQRCSSVFGQFQWVEVIRACYLIPGNAYPLCDDGGQWYYHAPGSGIWFNLGNTLVRHNKIDAVVFLVAQMAMASGTVSLSSPPGMTAYLQASSALPASALKQLYSDLFHGKLTLNDSAWQRLSTWSDVWTTAKQQVAKYMGTLRGDPDIFKVITSVISSSKAKPDTLPCIFYRDFVATGKAMASYDTLLLLLAGLIASVLAAVLALLATLAGRAPWPMVLVFVAVAAGLVAFVWFHQFSQLLASLGFVTLAGGLKKYAVTADAGPDSDIMEVLAWLCDPPPSEPDEATRERFMAFSGLPYTQVFDDAIENFAAFLGYDTVVMYAQPNKSGCYMVEMVDVTRMPAKPIWQGGLCGVSDATVAPPCEDLPVRGVRQALPFRRGGLCWPQSAGRDVGSGSSPYQQLNWQADQKVTLPDNQDNWSTYTASVKKLFVDQNRQPCDCADTFAPLQPYRCINCKQPANPATAPAAPAAPAASASFALCTMPL